MQVSGTCYIALSMVVISSIFIANILSIIAIYSLEESSARSVEKQRLSALKNEISMGAGMDHLLWFVQVTDIHLSIFHDESRISNFKEFCSVTVKAIKPKVVIASGDLTDAKSSDNMGSGQYEQEWIIYRDILKETNVTKNTVWLDIRGNHDNFNVLDLNSKNNFYRSHSVQGKDHQRSYIYQVHGSQGEVYSFIGLDACIEPGPKRPFNFIGVLKQADIELLQQLKKKADVDEKHYTIWFGHYPTSCIISPSDFKLREFIGDDPASLAFLCGHLHNMGGAVHNMYALQKTGFLELELIDWKENRMFRVAAIDHGFLSFTDVHLSQWPVILVTNPKNVNYMIGNKEPIEVLRNSSHVRILVFSESDVKEVKMKFDSASKWTMCDHVEGPLYVAEWNPNDFSSGLHDIHVHAIDSKGRDQSVSQSFALDKPRNKFGFFARLLLMANFSSAFQVMFGIMIVSSIIPLCLVRFIDHKIKNGNMKKPIVGVVFFKNWIRRLWLLGNIDQFFFPLIFYPLFLAFGPWCVGEIVEGHIGVIFAWGILVNHTYLPGGFTYAYGFNQLFMFHVPMTVIIGYSLDTRLNPPTRARRNLLSRTFHLIFNRHTLFFLLLLLQTSLAYSFSLAYGYLALFLNPLRTWPIFLALWLWTRTVFLSDRVIRNAAAVWLTS
ncbi:unnamed protein product [Bemisia tabaci]|uniref:Transmembrane protein 62 n=1 Tax=Bemisia tabaci TaxID=7038 RepID=A0A9P0A725_BEMTA|nr:PREDICTED: transmembrane protein 62-like [Bemisia tabaci]CAH0385963.1 unnamed protein product [Bemisia tabaci]